MGIILVVAFYGYLVVGVCWLIVSPKGRRLCRKQGEFWSTLVELFCGPVVYTVILICRNGIEELKLNVKQCKYAFSSQIKIDVLNYMSGDVMVKTKCLVLVIIQKQFIKNQLVKMNHVKC